MPNSFASWPFRLLGLTVVLASSTAAPAFDIRVATWNVSNYTGGRTTDIQNALFGSFEGRSARPDVIVTQEFTSAAAVSSFLSALNTAPGGFTDWAAANFTNGPDSDNAFFYRTSKATLTGQSIISAGGTDPLPPRDTNRYDLLLGDGVTRLSIYSSHMKAGTSSTDEARRLAEAKAIRQNARALGANINFLLAGDLNVHSSGDDAYDWLTESQANDGGRFFDPVTSPGAWSEEEDFKFLHTQDPSGAGGMDDRFDFILGGSTLFDGVGLDYVGNASIPYSTSTWNDPNHSYRVWGNDGTSFNSGLTINGNTMVGSSIAQSLVNAATVNGGHLPVFLDLHVAPVPEPASLAVLVIGGLGILARRRRS